MPERLEKLRAMLQDLERELASLATIDDETRTILEEAATEIQAALHKRDTARLEPHRLTAKLKETAERFEFSHPTLFGIVSRIIDGLAQMGI